ncbi:ATP-dependent dethiobiotin synthetase BioD [Legionella massiliensis]|uniref:ATP-dependent dethiobiotin synthetase BioD n=1 Tax=Legionella massiliensis TaxID=1034943 RepID=A0A078KVI4_9GAMM|nr:dethiobiotin synthase [Legionella massiliensis]CDZ78415.1 ATP-dependent dethiobiotin synthetase BioD [Legionella massiliensis]CEE14153.1 ATP-dependent dethiobiotin synthetase BioD [Legionella massiliensis]
MRPYFITGTDTDCGKTYVSCQLLDYFKNREKPALALKPVASGCRENNGQLESEDVLHLTKHNSPTAYPINGWQYAPPISPHLAAKAVNSSLSVKELASFCLDERYQSFSPLLIEGAGGLMVPLNDEETWVDFLTFTKIPAIVVVGMKLGCINHALLTDAVLKMNNIETVGWIANCLDSSMLALEGNLATLTDKMQIPLLGVLPYKGKFEGDNLERMLC